MLQKALVYYLLDDNPIQISDLFGIKNSRKQYQITQTKFLRTSNLKQIIIQQKRNNSLNIQRKIKSSNPATTPKYFLNNRSTDYRYLDHLEIFQQKRINLNQNTQNQNKPQLYFGIKHQMFKAKIQLQQRKLEDMF
ncbi:unnamed protein product [Paramecium sonneborni]|uniref:Uncharacterized protein n=1 Tax=Paramecium sonneborni TaxID=65129 RepID=A0A8S1P6A8_9CILI|nr:unnamed protein product [Paramecium sonneborni]